MDTYNSREQILFTDKSLTMDIEHKYAQNVFIKYFSDDEYNDHTNTLDMLDNEKNAYCLLNNVKYFSNDGRELFVTPQCFEIGLDYIVLEKYHASMYDYASYGDNIFSRNHYAFDSDNDHSSDDNNILSYLFHIIRNYIDPLTKKLDELHFSHNDIALRNFVFNRCLEKVSVIDFGVSNVPDEHADNYISTLLIYLFGCMDLYCMLGDDAREITFNLLGTSNDNKHIAECDREILQKYNLKNMTHDDFVNLHFSCPFIDKIELDKIYGIIHEK